MRPLAILGLVFLLGLRPASAAESKIFLSGHLWEDGGFPPSLPADELQAVGVINGIRSPLYWEPNLKSYTWYAHGLLSVSSVVIGTTFVTEYVGGEITIHVDGLPSNHDYGTYPDANTPATFTDGEGIYLRGKFQSCTVTFNTATASGAFVGEILFTAGRAYPNLQNPTGWTIGSSIAGTSPAGYSGQLNGAMYVDGPTDLSASSWASVKSLYR